jgi:hypothetical protein
MTHIRGRRPSAFNTEQRRHRVLRKQAVVAIRAIFAAVVGLGLSLGEAEIAAAAPPGFPDLNAFRPVDPAIYTMHFGRGGGGVFFATPDGLQCGWTVLPNSSQDHVSVGCNGPIPGLDVGAVGSDGCSGVGTSTSLPSDLGPYVFSAGGCPAITAPVLNVDEKITASNATCLVGADRLTACIDPILGRGFVLQPSGSWTF